MHVQQGWGLMSQFMLFTWPWRWCVLLSMGKKEHQEVAVVRTVRHSYSNLIHCPGKQALLLATADISYQRMGLPRACVTDLMIGHFAHAFKCSTRSPFMSGMSYKTAVSSSCQESHMCHICGMQQTCLPIGHDAAVLSVQHRAHNVLNLLENLCLVCAGPMHTIKTEAESVPICCCMLQGGGGYACNARLAALLSCQRPDSHKHPADWNLTGEE